MEYQKIALEAVKYLERGWIKGHLAKDAKGREVRPNDPDAVSWCMLGALLAAEADLHSAYGLSIVVAMGDEFREFCAGRDTLATFNDQICRDQRHAVVAMKQFAYWLYKKGKGETRPRTFPENGVVAHRLPG